jgi:hypothetical protein
MNSLVVSGVPKHPMSQLSTQTGRADRHVKDRHHIGSMVCRLSNKNAGERMAFENCSEMLLLVGIGTDEKIKTLNHTTAKSRPSNMLASRGQRCTGLTFQDRPRHWSRKKSNGPEQMSTANYLFFSVKNLFNSW